MQLPPARAPPSAPTLQARRRFTNEEERVVYVELDGSRIRNMRGSRAFTGEAFARRAGVSPKTLRRVERNRGPVTVSTARKIGRPWAWRTPGSWAGLPVGRSQLSDGPGYPS